jgi:hypothetical protein
MRYAGLRNIRNRAFLRDYLGSIADNAVDPNIPRVRLHDQVMLYGSWEDIGREVRFRKIWKERRLLDRRLSRKARGK